MCGAVAQTLSISELGTFVSSGKEEGEGGGRGEGEKEEKEKQNKIKPSTSDYLNLPKYE